MVLLLILFSVWTQVDAIDNGLGISPPMGWRSWNCYGGHVNVTKMMAIMDAMTSKKRTVDGKPTSLLEIGYENCGLDDNWQACKAGVGGSFHDSNGNPLVNTNRFPDMKKMTDYGHNKGLRVGWYHNNCICSEHNFKGADIEKHYRGDVNAIAKYGFDGVKLDGCGQFKNMTLWANLLNATGRPILIENCHWGRCTNDDTSSCPRTDGWCPFNFFRTSGDIKNNWGSMFRNLQTTRKWQNITQPLSRPGCWAYPDMLEVGRMASVNEDRSHFGAWCIVSAPLILGSDLTSQSGLDKVWHIITNREAIAVNQNWAGHPGRLIKEYDPTNSTTLQVLAETCSSADNTQKGWKYDSTKKRVWTNQGCLDATHDSSLMIIECNDSVNQQFTYNSKKQLISAKNGKCVDVHDWSGPSVQLYDCNGGTNQEFSFNSDSTLSDIDVSRKKCLAARTSSGDGIQIWGKPQPKSNYAVFVLNNRPLADPAVSVELDLDSFGIKGSVNVRDIWEQKDLGKVTTKFTTDAIDSHDSRFLLFSPQ